MSVSGIEVIKRLKKAGFVGTRQVGSHARLEKSLPDKIIKLTVPLRVELKKGTLHRIIKDASLTLDEFEELK